MWHELTIDNDPDIVGIKHSKSRELLAMWSSHAIREGLPNQRHFSARNIQDIFSSVMILRREKGKYAEFVFEYFGNDMIAELATFLKEHDLNTDPEFEGARQRIRSMMESCRPYSLDGTLSKNHSIRVRAICLPLANDEGELDAIMVYFTPQISEMQVKQVA